MRGERVARAAAADDEIEHALRRTRVVQDLSQRGRDGRRQRRGLHHHGVAERERRRALPRGNRDRKIPRRDEADDTERLAIRRHINARPRGVDGHAVPAQRLPREELEDAAGARHFADAFGQRLAFFAGQQPAQLVLAGQERRAHACPAHRCVLRDWHRTMPGKPPCAALTASLIAAPSSDGARATMSRVSDGFRLSIAALPRTHSPSM